MLTRVVPLIGECLQRGIARRLHHRTFLRPTVKPKKPIKHLTLVQGRGKGLIDAGSPWLCPEHSIIYEDESASLWSGTELSP